MCVIRTVTLEQSSVPSGLSPPLQISHSVVPKPQQSVARLSLWGFWMHSGGTHGIRSTRTGQTDGGREEGEKNKTSLTKTHSTRGRNYKLSSGGPTFPGQHGEADARVAELDEGQAARGSVLLPDQQDVLGADVAVDQVLVLLLGRGAEP